MGLFKKKDKYLKAFTSGKIIPITEVPDEVFAQKMMGDGIAIYPDNNIIVAPCDGKITAIMENTEHAVGITLANGVELLIHIGINTVELNGNYFTQNVEAGTHVEKGTCIVSFDIDKIKAEGYDPTVMVIVSNTPEYASVEGLKISNANADTSVIGISI